MAQHANQHPRSAEGSSHIARGTTIAGLRVLESHAVRSALIEAVTRATERSRELGKS